MLLIGLFEAFDGRVMQKADQICGSDLDQTAIQRFVTDPPRLFEQLLNIFHRALLNRIELNSFLT